IYNRGLHSRRVIFVLLLCGATAAAQEPKQQPQVRVNVINVCTPNADEQKVLTTALGKVPLAPVFGADFEITRGRSTMPDAPVSNWVRMRREFPPKETFSNAQFSVTVDTASVMETLVARWRDPADLVQLALEARVTAGGTAAVLASDTPVEHIRVERLGKSAVVLARCPAADQHAYDEIFAQ